MRREAGFEGPVTNPGREGSQRSNGPFAAKRIRRKESMKHGTLDS